MNYDGLADYRKLLEFGLRNFDKDTLHSSIENHTTEEATLHQLAQLNHYVFTYYSTNKDDVTFSLEFAIFADFLKPLTDILKAKGLWYMSKNYKTNEYDEWLGDSDEHDAVEPEVRVIPRNHQHKYTMNNDPMSWKIEAAASNNSLRIKRFKYVYFLNSAWIRDCNYKQDVNLFTDLYSNKHHTSIFESLANKVAIITIEDPTIGRDTLYLEVYNILRSIMNPILYPWRRLSSRKRKNRRTQRHRRKN